MKSKKRIYLGLVCLTFLQLLAEGIVLPKKYHHKEKALHNKTRKQNVPKSALVAIHPEELKLHPEQHKEVVGARKNEVNLQSMEANRVMNALSGKLSKLPKGEERIIKDFLKDMERSHGELTPSVMKKMVRIGGYQPFKQFSRHDLHLQGTQRSLAPNRKPVVLPFKLGAHTETFTNTESDIGEENPAYDSNPLPEYNYKELKYNLPTTADNEYRSNDYSDNDFHGNDVSDNDLHGNDYHENYFPASDYLPNDSGNNNYQGSKLHVNGYHGNDLRGNSYHGNSFNDEFHSNDLHINDDDYSKAFDHLDNVNDNSFGAIPDNGEDGQSKMAGIGSIVGRNGENLINEIGRKVLLNILQKQSEENNQQMSGKEVPDLLSAAEINPAGTRDPAFSSGTTDSLASRGREAALLSPAQKDDKQQNMKNIANTLADFISSNRAPQEITANSATSGSASQKIAQFINHLGLANSKSVTQEAQIPVENTLNFKVPNDQTPVVDRKIDISGKLNDVNDYTKLTTPFTTTPTSKISHDQATTRAVERKIDVSGKVNNIVDDTKVTTPLTTTPTSKSTSVAMTTSTVARKTTSKQNNDNPVNDDVVVLKISGQGKPVSFNADTSTDGSLVLKIPKKFSEKIIQPNGNQATESKNDGADAHLSNLNADTIQLLAGKMGKSSSLLSDHPQISDWEISGKQDRSNKNDQSAMIDLHPTRNVLPTDKNIPLPPLSSFLKNPGIQSQPETKHDAKTLVQAPQSEIPSSAGLITQNQLGHFDTPNNLIKSVFPNLVGLPVGAQNIEQLMTLLTRMDQLPSTQVGATAYDGMIPTNYAVRQEVGKKNPVSVKDVLKSSELVEDSGVARNKGIQTTKKKETGNDWSPCTVTCGQGIQARARPCQGKYCSGFATESRPCNSGPCPEQLAKSGLALQNTFRGWHRSPALIWSSSLASKAQKLADDLARNNDTVMLSDEMKELPGENIAVINQAYETAVETATRQWYGEVKGYSFTHPSLEDSTRHFTQVVWKGTKKVGIGLAKSNITNKTYVVALYDPPGNTDGQQKKNVKMPDMTNALLSMGL